MHINPDNFLETANGRLFTYERNNEAWKCSYRAFHQALAHADSDTEIYVLVGAQGSGKSTWAARLDSDRANVIIFDALLVKYRERIPILAAAESKRLKTIAVWFRTPLEVCLARNAARAADELVPEQAVRNVYVAIEPPTRAEGFERVIQVYPVEADA
ncbi:MULTISPECIES: AAA family ATPase [Azotobacter]|uniref:AAA family ATPase n=1 Tax=Azotobacter TaxID=352 RepID=UPI00005278EB|nr:AAA family ATPase [Azotobacter vinelandii]GLK57865.1 hypothetical protein GCM10017624_00220 [Azotobacter vinelandii]